MATADELLAGAMTEVEQILVINWETRTIDIPKTVTNIGVEYDDDTKHLKFSAPRYYHGTDLSEFRVAVGYWNADGEGDVYYPTDVTADDTTLTFTWIVGPHAVLKKGNVEFGVYMLTVDAETGATEQRVGTTLFSLPVLRGGDPGQTIVEEHYDAIASAVLQGLQMAQDTDLKGEPGYTPVKGVDYYTEQERNEFAETIVRDHNGAFANALKGTVSGSVIRVDDVSPIEHTVKCRVRGKNLVNVEDVTLEEFTGHHKHIALGFEVVAGQTYTLSMDVESTVEPFIASIGYGSALAYYVDARYLRDSTSGRIALTFTPTEDLLGQGSYVHVRVPRYATETTYSATISNIQLELGSVATEYEPYIDPTGTTVTACGKNLINVENVFLTDYTGYYHEISTGFEPVVGRQYVLSLDLTCDVMPTSVAIGCGVKNFESELTPYLAKDFNASGRVEVPFTWNITEENIQKGETKLAIRVPRYNAETTFSATVRNIQLEVGDTATAFEPYTSAEYTSDSDGSVDIVSVAPTMTLMTDTPGLTIEAEYSKDINCLHAAEVEKEIGDINNSLDAIIELQNELLIPNGDEVSY